jgi:TniQ
MQLISCGEDAWTSTFPYRVTPLADESLSGLLLRCDEINHWLSGTTSAYLLRNSTYNTSQSIYHVLVPPSWLLKELSERLAISLQRLHATTYLPELTQMYNLSKLPHPTLLNSSYFFHFCPECARNRVLRRTLMLAHLTFCPLHNVLFCQQCPCGSPQRLFCRQARPFTCNQCGLDWANFPLCSVSLEEVTRGHKLLKWYETFFSKGTPELFSETLKLIHSKLSGKKAGGVQLLDGKTRWMPPDTRGRISLGHLVDWLVSLDLSPGDFQPGKRETYGCAT